MQNHTNHINKLTKPFLKALGIFPPFRKVSERDILEIKNPLEKYGELLAAIPKIAQITKEQTKLFCDVGKILKNFAENTPEHLLLISKHGWFIDMKIHIKLPSDIYEELKCGNIEKVDNLFSLYYLENLGSIFQVLIERHKNRSEIFRELEESFNNGNYYTFIACILSQIDGICYDFTRKKFLFEREKQQLFTSSNQSTRSKWR